MNDNLSYQPPFIDKMVDKDGKISVNWQNFFSFLHNDVNDNFQSTYNPSQIHNADFNFSSTKGNDPTTEDGEFVDKWNVQSNGMGFVITPIYYTETKYSSNTGSERYINLKINTFNSSEFRIFQERNKMMSAIEGKTLSQSLLILNKNNDNINSYCSIIVNKDGTETVSNTFKSGDFQISKGIHLITSTIKCDAIEDDNQVNKIKFCLNFKNISSIVDIDIYYIKFEFGVKATSLVVDQISEKLILTNWI